MQISSLMTTTYKLEKFCWAVGKTEHSVKLSLKVIKGLGDIKYARKNLLHLQRYRRLLKV